MTADQPTVVFFPEGAFGPTNNCVGIADVLRRRGARCVFVVEESFAGTLEAKGFEEARMRLKPPPEVEEEPGQFWKDFVRDTAPEFRKPTIEQLETFIKPVWEELVDGAQYVQPRLEEIFAERRARRDRRGQRGRVPGGADRRRALGAHRVLQSARDEGPRPAAHVLGLRRPRTPTAGTRSGAGTRRCTRTCGRASATSA